MRLRRLVRRVIIAAVVVLALGLAGFAALLWWPAPSIDAPRCPVPSAGCVAVSGRVLYALSKDRTDRRRPLHLVLASRQSKAWPGVSVIKIPASLRPPRTPRVGRWVSAVGTLHRGSNGQTNLTVERLEVAR